MESTIDGIQKDTENKLQGVSNIMDQVKVNPAPAWDFAPLDATDGEAGTSGSAGEPQSRYQELHDHLESLQTSFDEIKDKHGNTIIEIQNMIKDKDLIIDEKQQKMEENIDGMIKENIKKHEDDTAIFVNRQILESIVQSEARTDAKFERSKEDTGRSPTSRLLSPY